MHVAGTRGRGANLNNLNLEHVVCLSMLVCLIIGVRSLSFLIIHVRWALFTTYLSLPLPVVTIKEVASNRPKFFLMWAMGTNL